MSKVTDFLHPLWQKAYKSKKNPNYEVNNAILEAIDQEMSKVEQQTLASKMQLFMRGASEEWLDYWGSWFGLKRQTGQSDRDYRNALVKHVEHPRDTIPALRKAIAIFLNEDVSAVHIYEPWTDVFILNDSKLNGKAHLMGDYYRYGVIDIQVNKPFDSGLIDVINWFRPGGVIWVLTYVPSDSTDTDIWEMSPDHASLVARLLYEEDLIGLDKHLDSNLTVNLHSAGYGLSPFILNKSYLNSTDVLKGSSDQSARYYNSIGFLQGLFTPQDSDTVTDFNQRVQPTDVSNYDALSRIDNQTIPFKITGAITNYNQLDNTADLTSWSTTDGQYVAQDTYQGRALLEFSASGAQSFAPNKIHLVKGNSYTFTTLARYLGTMTSGNINMVISDGTSYENNLTVKVASAIPNDFKQLSVTFESTLDTGDYYVGVQAIFEGATGCLIDAGSFVLRDTVLPTEGFGTSLPVWVPSKNDYPADYTTGNSYIYGAFNVQKFYYEHVESAVTVAQNLAEMDNQITIAEYMSQKLTVKNLLMAYSAKGISKQSPLGSIIIYNFQLGIWERYSTTKLTETDIQDKTSLVSLAPYLNSRGIVFIGLEVSQLTTDYLIDLDAIIFYFDKVNRGDFAINLYSSDMTLVTENSWDDTNYFELNSANDDLYAKNELGYPVQRIRVTYQQVSDGGKPGDKKAFTLNKSKLNSLDVIQDSQNPPVVIPDDPNLKPDYVQGAVTDATIQGMTVLAANFADSVHQNLLGNLASTDSKLRDSALLWACYDNSAVLDSTSNLAGFKTTTAKAIAGGNIEITSNSLFNEKSYQLSYQIATDTPLNITTSVYAVNNGVSYLVGQSKQAIAKSATTTTATDPFDQLASLSTLVTTDFTIDKFIPESISIIVSYDTKSNFQITYPQIYIQEKATLDGQSLSYLPDYYENNKVFISKVLPITDKQKHVIELDLKALYKINELDLGFTDGSYQVQLEVASSATGTYHTVKSNFADNSVITLNSHQVINVPLTSFNYTEDTVDKGKTVNQLIGAPDSHLSTSSQQEWLLSLMQYYFNTDSDLDISIHNGDAVYRVYSYIATDDQIIDPDNPNAHTPITPDDNLSVTELIEEAYKFNGVYGYLVDHDRLNTQLHDPVEFSKEIITPTTTTTTTASAGNTFKYMDLKIIKFNMIKQIKKIVPDFLKNSDKLSLTDQLSVLLDIFRAAKTSATVTVGVTSTNKVANISAYNYTKKSWDTFNTISDTTQNQATFSIPLIADYISPAGLLPVGVYGEATTNGATPDIITINSVEMPMTISQINLDNSDLQIKDALIATTYPRARKVSIDGSNLSLTSVELPNTVSHQGILRANLWVANAEGKLILQVNSGGETTVLNSYNLDYGNQAVDFSIDYDTVKTLPNYQLVLAIEGTKQLVYLNSVQIFNCLSK